MEKTPMGSNINTGNSSCLFAEFKNYLNDFLFSTPLRFISVAAVVLLGYGEMMVETTINNDACYMLRSTGFMASTIQERWGKAVLELVGLLDINVPFWSNFLGALILVFSGIIFCFLWHKISDRTISYASQLFFLLLYVSYPLTLEIGIYPTSLLGTAVLYTMMACVFTWIWCTDGKLSKTSLFVLSILTATIFSGYETFLFAYITYFLLIAFYLFYTQKISKISELSRPVKYLSVVIILGLIIRFILIIPCHFSNSLAWSFTKGSNGAGKTVHWFSDGISHCLVRLIAGIGYSYLYSSVFYFAIFVFVVSCVLLFYFAIRSQRRWLLLLCAAMAVGSCFGMSVVTGMEQPYRFCQSFPLLIASAGMLMTLNLKGKAKTAVFILLGYVVLMQTKELSLLQSYDAEISQQFKHDLLAVGHDLKQVPGIENKRIIMLGKESRDFDVKKTMTHPCFYNMPALAPDQRGPQAIGMHHFTSSRHGQLQRLMEYFNGLKVSAPESKEGERLEKKILSEKIPSYPTSGYIFQDGDTIVVNIGVAEQTNTRDFGALGAFITPVYKFIKGKNGSDK